MLKHEACMCKKLTLVKVGASFLTVIVSFSCQLTQINVESAGKRECNGRTALIRLACGHV